MNDLDEIAKRYNTDKVVHTHYLRNYEEHFGGLREKKIRLLELGIHEGGSLLLWKDFFQNGLIVGIDVSSDKIHDPSGRIRTYQGLQQDSELLDRIASENAPEGFDIIIDDCSHIGVFSRASFWHLFDKHLKSGGLYVIEDWGTGYWDSWIDGVGYSRRTERHQPANYFLSRVIFRLQRNSVAQRLPLAGRIISWTKANILRRQFRSHDFGMVGFVKELIDELGIPDITHPEFGLPPHKSSKFREMRLSPGQLFIVKS